MDPKGNGSLSRADDANGSVIQELAPADESSSKNRDKKSRSPKSRFQRQQDLLGNLGLNVIGCCVTWTQAVCCSPYEWHWQNQDMIVSKSKLRYFFWLMNVTWTVCYGSYLVMRIVEIEQENGIAPPSVELVVMYLWVGFITVVLIMQWALLQHYEEIPPSIRRTKIWLQQVSGYYNSHPNPEIRRELRSRMDVTMLTFLSYDIPCLFLWITMSLLYPQSSLYMTSLLPDAENLGIPGRILGAILYSYSIISCYATGYFWTLCIFPAGFSIPTVLKLARMDLELDRRANYSEFWHKQSHMISAQYYRQAQLVSLDFNQVYCSIVVPAFKWIVITVGAYCCCGFVMTRDTTRWYMLSFFLACVIIVIILFGFYGKFYGYSEDFLEFCHKNWTTKLDRKVLRHLQPLKVSMAGVYDVDMLAPLVILQTFIDMTLWFIFTKHGDG